MHPPLSLGAQLVAWKYIMTEDGGLYAVMDLIKLMLMWSVNNLVTIELTDTGVLGI